MTLEKIMPSSILLSLNWNKAGELEVEDLEFVLKTLSTDVGIEFDEYQFLLRRNQAG